MTSQNPPGIISSNNTSQSAHYKTLVLALVTLGVVFGDIGTSPLYALRECFMGVHGLLPTSENVFGTVSLIFWSLILIVSIKYVLFVMQADNRGEGGILALMTLANQARISRNKKYSSLIVSLGILGAALLYGNGVITPAISVLSAMEGLTVITPLLKSFVVPLSLLALLVLFFLQSKGTAKVGSLFGPVILLWFIIIGILGLFSIIHHPAILYAMNPVHAIRFFLKNGFHSFATLGSIFLAVTGAEVLYADLGHFGKKPIRSAWFYIAFPGLLLNYFGQGSYLLGPNPSIDNLFYRIAPSWSMYPLVALATAATVIASQALITGAFSLAKQSVQLGFWPRIQIRHTSTQKIGQIYIPFINWSLLLGTVLLILALRESSNLASAYGIAVSGTMLITTILFILVAHRLWSMRLSLLIPIGFIFLAIDSAFFLANITKIPTGGWIALAIAFAIYLLMKTWIVGRDKLRRKMIERSMAFDVFMQTIDSFEVDRVSGIAVFLAGNPVLVPDALLHNLKHNKVLHEKAIILTVKTEEIPYVQAANRSQQEFVGKGIYRVFLNYGFSETPDIPKALEKLQFPDFQFEINKATFFLGREALHVADRPFISIWYKKLFSFMAQNSLNATNFFKLPPNRVVELGSMLEL